MEPFTSEVCNHARYRIHSYGIDHTTKKRYDRMGDDAEVININTNSLFRGVKNTLEIKQIYEAFWNIPSGQANVTVTKVEPVA